MISSTWSFKSSLNLLACGIDLERIDRFDKWAGGGDNPPDFVFSKKETDYVRTLSDPALGLCACFCCKEAVVKALGEPFSLTRCELLPDFFKETNEIRLSPDLREKYGIGRSEARILRSGLDARELVVIAYIFGKS